MTSTFDVNKFNDFIDSANEVLTCDTTCQNNKIASDLEQNYLNAKSNLLTAPSQLEQARQKYITFTKGASGYQEYQDKEYELKATSSAATYSSTFDEKIKQIQSEIQTYQTLLQNFINSLNLNDKYINEINYLKNELKTKSYEIITNDRKTYYEDQENNNLLYYLYLLSTIYILLLILYLILLFTHSSSFSWISRIAIFIFLVLYYYIGTSFLKKIISIINKIFSFFPKNVYTSV